MIARGRRSAPTSASSVGQGVERTALGLVARDELLGPAGGAVVDGDRVAVIGDVERQVLAHDAETDQADLRLRGL